MLLETDTVVELCTVCRVMKKERWTIINWNRYSTAIEVGSNYIRRKGKDCVIWLSGCFKAELATTKTDF